MPEHELSSTSSVATDVRPTPRPASAGSPSDAVSPVPTSREPERSAPLRAPDGDRAAVDALGLIADASAALASALDLDDVLEAVGRIAVPCLADVCVIDLAATDDEVAERRLVATTYDADTEALVRDDLLRFPIAEYDERQALELAAGEPVFFADLAEPNSADVARSAEQLARLRRLHAGAALVVPLIAGGRTLGTMRLVSTEAPRTPSNAEVAVARELGHRVAQAVFNARLYRTARRSEERLALALEGGDQGFWDWDLRTNRVFVDRRLCAVLGRTLAEVGDRPTGWMRLVHPADRTRVQRDMQSHMHGRTPCFEAEYRMQHADGSWRWILSRCRVVERDVAGRPMRLAGTHTDVTVRHQGDDAREVLAQTVEASGDLIATAGPDGRVIHVNPAGLRLVGASSLDEVRGRPFAEFHTDDERPMLDAIEHELIEGSGPWSGECHLRRVDGLPPVLVEAYKFAVRDPATDEFVALACVARDLTERRAVAAEREQLAERTRHAQRIESLGVLAGGVAHDFNNLLTVILTTVDLARADLPPSHDTQSDLDAIRSAATRASQLTRQLLAFSRRQALEPRLLDLNAVVAEADGMLRRMVSERITIDTSLVGSQLPIRADPVQLEQVLVNLVLNARDAVAVRPDGGVITVETGETKLGAAAAQRHGLKPGRYVSVNVHDTGIGMDAATQARVFEPFFTTKPLGQGTGLGLAMVYGIVTQSGGTITIESTPGHGSTFRVLLPRAADETASHAATPDTTPPRGRETVLLVEDEAAVRGVARRILERAGYTVYEARHGADALLVWREQGGARGTIDVLLTDLRMPELDGRELADRLRHDRPNLPVVFMSGYAEDDPSAAPARPTRGRVAEGGPGYGTAVAASAPDSFLAKPFLAPELQRAIREALDARTA